MNISKVFVKRPVMTTLVFITILFFGIGAYLKMPVAELPTVSYPIIKVTTNYPGADPQTMASTVSSPLEKQFMSIAGLESILSTSTEGQSQIVLTFNVGTNINEILTNIQNAISSAKSNLPDDLPNDPGFKQVDPSARPIIDILVTSDSISHKELYNIANQEIAQQASTINGVSEVTIRSVPAAIRIKLNPSKMADYNVTLDEIKTALNNENVNISTGSLSGKYDTYSIEANGQLTTAEGYNNLVVKYDNGSPIRIEDIGKAYLSTENENFSLNYYDAKKKKVLNPIMIEITRQTGSNTIQVANDVKKLITRLNLPSSVNASIIYDQSGSILNSINDVKDTLYIAFFLVILIIFIFMGKLKDTLIPVLALPVSLIFSFLIMYFLNFSLDNLSLMAMTLAVGFVVDDAIVVLENNSRHIELGEDPKKAAIKSAKEITGSVISMTLSLVIVFVPIVFMSGIIGKTFREFALTVIITVICSGIVSLTLTPMMCSKFLNRSSISKKNKLIEYKDKILDRIIKFYSKILDITLKKYRLTIVIWLICMAGSIAFYFMIPKTFIPNGDSGNIFGMIKTPLGVSSEQVKKYQNYVNTIFDQDKNISHFFTITGMSDGADQSTGRVMIMLKPESKRLPISDVIHELSVKISKIPFPLGKVYLTAKPVLRIPTGGNNTALGAEYSYTITGNNQDEVYKSASELETALKNKPAFQDIQSDVNLDMKQLSINILRDKASSLGITTKQIEDALNLAFAQGKSGYFSESTNQYDVIIQNNDKASSDPSDLSKIYLKSQINNELVPLSSVITSKETIGPQSVSHYQQFVSATISFNLKSGTSLEYATETITDISKTIFPISVQGEFLGTAQQFLSAIASLAILILVAVFLKYIVLGILYEDFIHPLTVLTTLPTAAVGGLGTLLLFGSQLSLYAYIGMFLLIGLVAKNGIMIVDFALQRIRNDNVTAYEAVHSACIIRFRPIIMTGLTAIVGALPIAIGIGADAELRRPLGLIIVGGLIFSQLISLFMVPGFFLLFNSIKEKFSKKSYISEMNLKNSGRTFKAKNY
ncbi:MAG TPA: efflux RND transporter permease subunit [Victivallales bacterium]|nr:efflux RND transporter permease subunit [Victivallales bacterium]